MSKLCPLEVGVVWINESLIRILEGAWRKEKRGERRKEEKGEEEARFIKIVEFSLWISSGVIPTRCNFELNVFYIEVINDSKCFGKEPSEIRGFRVEKRRRKFGVFLGGGWGAAPPRAPQKFL
uniref:Uncharacterized protein n=1 Tax=Solanum tuberosum TaxID=4113 RepID=M1DEY9_SOLTU